MNIFEQASQLKLRFQTPVGQLSVEQLWDLPLKSNKGLSLQKLAIEISAEITSKPTTTLSFFDSEDTTDPILSLKFEIVKSISISKMEANKAKSEEKARETEKAEILELIKEKEQEDRKKLSTEELKAMYEKLK